MKRTQADAVGALAAIIPGGSKTEALMRLKEVGVMIEGELESFGEVKTPFGKFRRIKTIREPACAQGGRIPQRGGGRFTISRDVDLLRVYESPNNGYCEHGPPMA